MLNSKKLLYVFSDVAYVAELLPAKKKGDFKIQEFRQINGEFLDNDTFIPENIDKLFSKLDKEEYLLVLPDFFFTNTIIEIAEKAKTKVDKYIDEELLPSLNIKEETHQIEHFVLTQYGDKSNVQLSAVERSLLAPIFAAAKKHEIKVLKTVSLSWTIKSLISLEPSLSLVQMGENIYLVQHYIGIDQATSAPVTDVEKIAETIKTLKGAEPSIQTVYLLTNELVEEKLKELLKSTLPLQQLSDFKEEDTEVPSYVNQVIEAGAKTLSVPEFNVPDFKIEEVDAELIEEAIKAKKSTKETEVETEKEEPEVTDEASEEEDVEEIEPVENEELKVVTGEKTASEETPLPEPTSPPSVKEVITPVSAALSSVPEVEVKTEDKPQQSDDFEVVGEAASSTEAEKDDILDKKEEKTEAKTTMPEEKQTTSEILSDVKDTSPKDKESDALSQFAVVEEQSKIDMKEPKTSKEPKSGVIKNKTGVNSMLRMVFVSLSVFFLTVGIGVGLGLGYLTISNKDAATEQPEVIAEEVTEEPTPSPTPSPSPEIAKDEVEILVVNATTKAGYAGDIKILLTDDEFTNVDAANAKGDYEAGNYVLMKEENSGLIDLISKSADIDFKYSDEIKTEDIKGVYDAVVVLAE